VVISTYWCKFPYLHFFSFFNKMKPPQSDPLCNISIVSSQSKAQHPHQQSNLSLINDIALKKLYCSILEFFSAVLYDFEYDAWFTLEWHDLYLQYVNNKYIKHSHTSALHFITNFKFLALLQKFFVYIFIKWKDNCFHMSVYIYGLCNCL
jgi:hypothetical protein